jgi:hypothetical protein
MGELATRPHTPTMAPAMVRLRRGSASQSPHRAHPPRHRRRIFLARPATRCRRAGDWTDSTAVFTELTRAAGRPPATNQSSYRNYQTNSHRERCSEKRAPRPGRSPSAATARGAPGALRHEARRETTTVAYTGGRPVRKNGRRLWSRARDRMAGLFDELLNSGRTHGLRSGFDGRGGGDRTVRGGRFTPTDAARGHPPAPRRQTGGPSAARLAAAPVSRPCGRLFPEPAPPFLLRGVWPPDEDLAFAWH